MASAADVERGKYILHNGNILQVVKKEIIAVGTHSHTKIRFTVANLQKTSEKLLIMGHEDRVEILDIMKKISAVISKNQTGVQIMDPDTYETYDATVDPELLEELTEGEEVVYVVINGVAKVISKRAQTS